ncbi:MAG: CRISPR-associated endonuclease Cas1, partial [Rhodoferax sp.]|nr:CRISPR-associated endonuclease Cas1 [Rhodoferax sp.]
MGALLRQSLTLTRLRAAYDRVAQNNGQAGVDGISVDNFAAGLAQRLGYLQSLVLGGNYQPDALLRLWLPRPGKAPRPLGIPTVRDRVLHTAVAQTLTPLLEAEFEDCSFAYRQGRSVRMAVERITMLQCQGYRWVVEADIEHFFDGIPHARLLSELRRVVADDELINLVSRILRAPVQDDNQRSEVSQGVAQGSPLSPLLANLYLDRLDDALLDENLALVRYADDFVVLTKSRERAQEAVELTSSVLQDLELKLNPLKTRVVNFETGFQFLGWNFVRSLAVPAKARTDTDMATETPPPGQPDSIPNSTQGLDKQAQTATTNEAISGAMASVLTQAMADQPKWQAADIAPAPYPTPPDPAKADEDAATDAAAVDAPDSTDDCDPLARQSPALPPPSLQRTLYLLDPNASLATENRHLVVRRDTEVLLDLPAVQVDQVMLFGRNAVTSAALICCAQHGIPVAYLSKLGKFYGRFEPVAHDNTALLATQFAAHASASLDLPLAREFVRGKLGNSTLLISRYARHRPADSRVTDATRLLRDLAYRTKTAESLESLRGLEGAGAAAYFGVWRMWLAAEWKFGARTQQSGSDPINS